MRRTRVLLAVSAAAATAVVVAGCGGAGGGSGQDDQGASTPSSSSPSNSVGPTVGTSKTKPPTARPTDTHIDTTLTGTAVRGVEPGCIGIKAKGKTYQLSGDEARELAKSGGEGQSLGKVKVSGHFAPKGMASTCMMGDIFVVVKLKKV